MRIPPLVTALLLSLSCACPSATETAKPGGGSAAGPGSQPAPAPAPSPGGDTSGQRTPAVPASHPQYQRVEGTSFQNGCSADDQCFVGGCSNEICSAEQGVSSTCEAPVDGWPTTGATCGCVQGQCVWYASKGSGSGSGSGQASASGSGLQGQACAADGSCAHGLTCMTYYGVAGPRGPQFTSCEIPCAGGKPCPSGQTCSTIADGPGSVCRAGG